MEEKLTKELKRKADLVKEYPSPAAFSDALILAWPMVPNIAARHPLYRACWNLCWNNVMHGGIAHVPEVYDSLSMSCCRRSHRARDYLAIPGTSLTGTQKKVWYTTPRHLPDNEATGRHINGVGKDLCEVPDKEARRSRRRSSNAWEWKKLWGVRRQNLRIVKHREKRPERRT